MSLSLRDLKKVRNLLHPVRRKWLDIGIEFEIEHEELKIIEEKYKDPIQSLREMISVWLRTDPKLEALVDALNSETIDEKRIAERGIISLEYNTGSYNDLVYLFNNYI